MTDAPFTQQARPTVRDEGLRSWLAVDHWPVMVAFIDAAFVYRFANQAFAAGLNTHPSEIIGCNVGQVDGADRCGLLYEPMAAALAGVATRVRTEWAPPCGAHRTLDVNYLPRQSRAGRVDGFHVVAFDITDLCAAQADGRRHKAALDRETAARACAEASLRQSQKMEVVGQLTSGLAHDVNNMLMGALCAIDAIRRRVPAGQCAEVDRALEAAATSASRASGLVRRLLAFARPEAVAPRPLEVNGLVRSLEDLLRLSLPPGVSLELNLDPGLPLAGVDRQQLETALLNLTLNARDAMPEGGVISVRTAPAMRLVAGSPAPHIALSVVDTGAGIDPLALERIVEPFFTTKSEGSGTGLGLTMVAAFAAGCGGTLQIESELGCGTTAVLHIPALTTPPPIRPGGAPA